MDSRHTTGVNPLEAPQIQRREAVAEAPAPTPVPLRHAWEAKKASKHLSVRWSALLFVASAITTFVGAYLAPVDPNAADPTGITLGVVNLVALSLSLIHI